MLDTSEWRRFLHAEGFICWGQALSSDRHCWSLWGNGARAPMWLLRIRGAPEGGNITASCMDPPAQSLCAVRCRLFSRRRSGAYTTCRASKSCLLSQFPGRMALCCWLSIPGTHRAGRICPLSNLQGTLLFNRDDSDSVSGPDPTMLCKGGRGA